MGNKFAFVRGIFEKVWTNEEHTTCTYKHVGDTHYAVEVINVETIRVTRDDESKDVLVRRDFEFVYSLKKGYIRARDQAEGLYKHLKSCIREDDGTVWNSANLYTVCDWVIDEMKPIGKRPPMTMNKARFDDAIKWSSNVGATFVDIADGWSVSADYHKGSCCYAHLMNWDKNIEYTMVTIGDVTKANFVKVAGNDLWSQYEEANENAA